MLASFEPESQTDTLKMGKVNNKKGLKFVENCVNRCVTFFTYSSIAAISVLTCLTATDAIGRYFFNKPILAAYELTEQYLMVAGVFLGIAYAYNEGGYIRVSFLSDRLPRSIKIGIKYLVQFFSAGLNCILVFATGHQALKIFARRETLQVVDIPLWPAYAIVPLGLLLVSLRMVIDTTKIETDRSSLFKEESTSA